MSVRSQLVLALRLVRRDWHSGELLVLMLALLIAVASATAVSLLGHRLTRTMTLQAAEFLAADLSVRDHDPLPADWDEEARTLGLRHARTVEFSSVLVENEDMLLCGIKAVSPGYPLRGALRSTLTDMTAETATQEVPEPGTAWVEQRVLTSLNLAVGQTIHVGDQPLTVTRILTHEPDRRGELWSLSPRVLMNLADLEATHVLQPGSHAHFYAMYAGDEPAVRALKARLKPRLAATQQLVDVHEDRPEVGNAINRAERYLGLSSIVIVLIAGVAVAMSARRYSERHFDMTAMLKCLGASKAEVLRLYLFQFLAIGLAGSLAGCALGFVAQEGVLYFLARMLPHSLASPAWYAPLFGAAVGLLILLGFALPPVLQLRGLSPLRVLRRDLAPLPPSGWLVYGLAAAALAVLIWRYTEDGRMTAMVLGIGFAALAGTGLVALGLLRGSRLLLPRLGLSWRFGLQNLTRQPRLAVTQILAFSLTLVAMQISVLVRTELIQEWRQQLPEQAPNQFALNLFETDLAHFQALSEREGFKTSAYYPVIRGRLTAVNGEDVHRIATKESQGEAAINRDLSLTYSGELPPDNRILQGRWWNDWTPGNEPGVSVEAKLAESLGIRLGDRLSFTLGDRSLVARVASLRSVRWDAMTPNFYMIFEPGALKDHARTYITSFYVPPEQKSALSRLAKAFPAVTLLDVEALLKQFQTILREVTLAIEFVLAFALAAGITVLFAAVRATLDSRLREDALLRAMGASRKLLRRSQWLEFCALGFLSGVLSTAIAELIAWSLFVRVFDLEPHVHWEMWLSVPLLGAASVGVAGYLNTRVVVREAPWKALRDL
ncbi:ABC transporter permease [Methyloterricola oryzae]|uniref:ABC transporter permease n=1 Tax=Methyloterricola oryzae TaxID=1495050 RepID=UPI0005EB377D|nr:FtsX-like permease family protein [Methyloterricola oryzae]